MKRRDYDMKIVGENMKRLRLAKGLTVEQVRDYLGFSSVQAIYKYEEGRGMPQADTLLALMELYGADSHDITDKHDDTPFEQKLKKAIKKVLDRGRNANCISSYLDYVIRIDRNSQPIVIER